MKKNKKVWKVIGVRVTPEMLDKIYEVSIEQEMTLASTIRHIIRYYIQQLPLQIDKK